MPRDGYLKGLNPVTREFVVVLSIETDDPDNMPNMHDLATALDSVLQKHNSPGDPYQFGSVTVYDNLRWLVEDWEEGEHKHLDYAPVDEFSSD
jgi:hypothetical protein